MSLNSPAWLSVCTYCSVITIASLLFAIFTASYHFIMCYYTDRVSWEGKTFVSVHLSVRLFVSIPMYFLNRLIF